MDYEKMYKAVLKTATQWIKDGCSDKEKICLESIFPELRESEDKRRAEELIKALQSGYYEGYQHGKEDTQKEQNLNPSKSVGLKEQKPAEWSEEDEKILKDCIDMPYCADFISSERKKDAIRWLKSLRPQPKQEIYQSAKHDLAIKFMNYLDENRPEGKMSLSNAECEDIDKAFKENDWNKIFRYIEKYGRRN